MRRHPTPHPPVHSLIVQQSTIYFNTRRNDEKDKKKIEEEVTTELVVFKEKKANFVIPRKSDLDLTLQLLFWK